MVFLLEQLCTGMGSKIETWGLPWLSVRHDAGRFSRNGGHPMRFPVKNCSNIK